MMTCAYHPGLPSASHCRGCLRPLCRACDHRIRGVSYCQDCIVEGIDILQKSRLAASSAGSSGHYSSGHYPEVERRPFPILALLCSLFPGLGAVYNGQNVKALLLFSLIAGLEALGNQLSGSLESLFTLGGGAVYLCSLFDAYRSASRARRGANLLQEDEELRRLLRQKTNLAGGLLILAGSLVILNTFWPTLVNRFWPILLVIAGAIALRRRLLQR